jgi:hypothetical protein
MSDVLFVSAVARQSSHMKEIRINVVARRQEKRPLGRPKCRWEDNITMDLKI